MAPTEPAARRWREPAARYAGLAATTLMAVLSWWVGALPWQHPAQLSPAVPLLPGPAWHGVGVGLWVAATAVLVTAWLLVGRGVREGRVSRRDVLVTAALWAAPLLLAVPLASHDVYSYACQGQAYIAGADPYRTGPASLPCRWLTATAPIWRNQPTPYGPIAILISAVAEADRGPMLLTLATLRLAAVAGLAMLAVSLPRLAIRSGRDPATALWLGLANPVVLIHLVGGAHHDALMAGLTVAGLTVAASGRAIRAGATVGLAAAVKATAVVVLPFTVLLALGSRPGTGARAGVAGWARAAAMVGLAAAASFGLITLAAGLDLGWMGALPVAHQPISWLSPPTAVGAVVGAVLSWALAPLGGHLTIPGVVEAARAVALYTLLPVVLVAIWWRTARAGRPWAGGDPEARVRAIVLGAGAALAATVALGPVAYPWYAVTPVAVLAAAAGTRTRRAIAVVLAVLTFVILPDSRNVAIFTRWPGMVAEVAALVVLAWWLARRGRRRAQDGVAGGQPGAAGGEPGVAGSQPGAAGGQPGAGAGTNSAPISSAGSGGTRWKP
jgi:hypothetical protein